MKRSITYFCVSYLFSMHNINAMDKESFWKAFNEKQEYKINSQQPCKKDLNDITRKVADAVLKDTSLDGGTLSDFFDVYHGYVKQEKISVSQFGIKQGLDYHKNQLKIYFKPKQENLSAFFEQLENSIKNFNSEEKEPIIIGALEYLIANLSENMDWNLGIFQ